MPRVLQRKGGQLDTHEHPQYALKSDLVGGANPGGLVNFYRGTISGLSPKNILPKVTVTEGVHVMALVHNVTSNQTQSGAGQINFDSSGPIFAAGSYELDLYVTPQGKLQLLPGGTSATYKVSLFLLWVWERRAGGYRLARCGEAE